MYSYCREVSNILKTFLNRTGEIYISYFLYYISKDIYTRY